MQETSQVKSVLACLCKFVRKFCLRFCWWYLESPQFYDCQECN